MDEEEEEEEEWLMESLRLYNDLHVFELPTPTRVIEWMGDHSICVAGYGNGGRNEILQLRLPPRLQAKENKSLCPERDFKVERGGISVRPVYSLKHLPGTSLLVTSGPPGDALQVWRMESEETDIIKPLSTVSTAKAEEGSWVKIATSSTCVLHGLRFCDLQMTEIESGRTVFGAASSSTDRIASLDFLDEAAAVACSSKGQLFLADSRQPQTLRRAAEDCPTPSALGDGPSWCAGVGRGQKPLLARLSSRGLVVLTDLRNPSRPLKASRCQVPLPAACGAEFLAVSWAPLLRECLAVSGFDGTVQVYDTDGWDSSWREAEPVFIHKEHVFSGRGSPAVTAHTWHPQKPQALLSAASDGALHVWDWSDPRGAREWVSRGPLCPPAAGSAR